MNVLLLSDRRDQSFDVIAPRYVEEPDPYIVQRPEETIAPIPSGARWSATPREVKPSQDTVVVREARLSRDLTLADYPAASKVTDLE